MVKTIITVIRRHLEYLILFILHPCLFGKIKETIDSDENILREKGYLKNTHINISNYKLSLNINSSITLPNLPEHGLLKNNILLIKYSSAQTLLEASLSVFVWACLLPALENSVYKQYEKEAEVLWNLLIK